MLLSFVSKYDERIISERLTAEFSAPKYLIFLTGTQLSLIKCKPFAARYRQNTVGPFCKIFADQYTQSSVYPGDIIKNFCCWMISWLYIATAITHFTGWVNEFLSWPGFVPLSRMTYCAYLVHPVIMTVFYASHKSKVAWDETSLVCIFYYRNLITS